MSEPVALASELPQPAVHSAAPPPLKPGATAAFSVAEWKRQAIEFDRQLDALLQQHAAAADEAGADLALPAASAPPDAPPPLLDASDLRLATVQEELLQGLAAEQRLGRAAQQQQQQEGAALMPLPLLQLPDFSADLQQQLGAAVLQLPLMPLPQQPAELTLALGGPPQLLPPLGLLPMPSLLRMAVASSAQAGSEQLPAAVAAAAGEAATAPDQQQQQPEQGVAAHGQAAQQAQQRPAPAEHHAGMAATAGQPAAHPRGEQQQAQQQEEQQQQRDQQLAQPPQQDGEQVRVQPVEQHADVVATVQQEQQQVEQEAPVQAESQPEGEAGQQQEQQQPAARQPELAAAEQLGADQAAAAEQLESPSLVVAGKRQCKRPRWLIDTDAAQPEQEEEQEAQQQAAQQQESSPAGQEARKGRQRRAPAQQAVEQQDAQHAALQEDQQPPPASQQQQKQKRKGRQRRGTTTSPPAQQQQQVQPQQQQQPLATSLEAASAFAAVPGLGFDACLAALLGPGGPLHGLAWPPVGGPLALPAGEQEASAGAEPGDSLGRRPGDGLARWRAAQKAMTAELKPESAAALELYRRRAEAARERRQQQRKAAAQLLACIAGADMEAPMGWLQLQDARSRQLQVVARAAAEAALLEKAAAEGGGDVLDRVEAGGEREVVLQVALHLPQTPQAVSEEWLVLGSQSLCELRDRLFCVADSNLEAFEREENRRLERAGRPPVQLKKPSAYFYIEGTFYNDLRHPEAADYSEPIRRYNREQGAEAPPHPPPGSARTDVLTTEFSAARMERTRFDELWLRVGAGAANLYCHQGGCEHLLSFLDIRLYDPSCDPQLRRHYPFRLTHPQHMHMRDCEVCGTHAARRVSYEDRAAPHTPFFWCEDCFNLMHCDEQGNLLDGDLKVVPYTQEHAAGAMQGQTAGTVGRVAKQRGDVL
ncbi:snRNA-activating complex subunit-like isoform X2 [Micractinium conductrix]|uniref:snRNA-activating complex subunit-like isoform X2 n=1 Tax=Micractinium conductrix TaxID=554055 RepID=A0A2P6V5M6_9CHLO|nr:snRNA-activating complex subunit-like isoform X2 [Micractinium conductrix]|eukprot:PSC69390.1 snRNA-activating complex subunit-like isoform X2 [Micractinium conductrix]